MRLDIAWQTDRGRRKKNNEDFFGVFREDTTGLALFRDGALLCVADGLGGHVGGEIASKLAVSLVKDVMKKAPPEPNEEGEIPDEAYHEILKAGFALTNDNIYQTNKDHVKGRRPMGTTLLVALVLPEKVHIAYVGDSRCYLLRDNEIITFTEDHSWVDEQVKLGLMTKSEAESDARRNIVTRCIGTHPDVSVDTYTWEIQPDDRLLLCTDGLVNMVKDAEIKDEFRRGGTSAEITQRLVRKANENGGKDNITVIIAHISPNPLQFIAMRVAAFFRQTWRALVWILVAIVFGAICFAAGYCVRGLTL